MNGYKTVKVGKISQAKLKKALKGGAITLTKSELEPNDFELVVHPENYKKITQAQKRGMGTRIQLTRGEADHDLAMHHDGTLQGGSLWSWLKDTVWPIAKKVIGVAADGITYANPELAPIREGVRSLTGVGMKPAKGSPEMKAHMAELRSKKKAKGGSFRLS